MPNRRDGVDTLDATLDGGGLADCSCRVDLPPILPSLEAFLFIDDFGGCFCSESDEDELLAVAARGLRDAFAVRRLSRFLAFTVPKVDRVNCFCLDCEVLLRSDSEDESATIDLGVEAVFRPFAGERGSSLWLT